MATTATPARPSRISVSPLGWGLHRLAERRARIPLTDLNLGRDVVATDDGFVVIEGNSKQYGQRDLDVPRLGAVDLAAGTAILRALFKVI